MGSLGGFLRSPVDSWGSLWVFWGPLCVLGGLLQIFTVLGVFFGGFPAGFLGSPVVFWGFSAGFLGSAVAF